MVSIHVGFANTCGPIKAMNGAHIGDLVYHEPYEDWETSIRLHLDLFSTCYIEIIPAE